MEKGKRSSLVEYSTKHGVSISTLRRRIKEHSIDFIEDGGKYFILESGSQTIYRKDRLNTQKGALQKAKLDKKKLELFDYSNENSADTGFSSANKTLEELKKAYTQILHEREEQIIQLREEITDLKTLVKILESENERLKK